MKMSVFEPKESHLGSFAFFSMKKSAVESHRLPVEVYGDAALSET